MNSLSHHDVHSHVSLGARERVTVQNTRYASCIAGADKLEARWELSTSLRPAPIKGIAVMHRRSTGWTIVAGTWGDIIEMCKASGDNTEELLDAVKADLLAYAERVDELRYAAVRP